MTCPLLDDLFGWAAEQPATNSISVACNLATNQSTFQGRDHNLVSYAEGELTYSPGGWIVFGAVRIHVPPSFAGSATQYFSDRRYNPPQSLISYPFDPANTDQLDISISSASGYPITIQSPKWGLTQNLTPQCGAGVVYATLDNAELLVISLCNRSSQPRPQ